MPSQSSRAGTAASVVVGLVALAAALIFATSFFQNGVPPSPSPAASPSALAQATPTTAATATRVPAETPAPTKAPSPSPTAVPLPSTLPAILTGTIRQYDPAGAWRVTFQYPRFASGSTPFGDGVNGTIKDDADLVIAEFEQGRGAVKTPGFVNSLTASFSVALLTPSVVSFRLKTSENYGGAHPEEKLATITFDLATGDPVGFNDVFADPQAALAILSVKSRDLLRQSLGTDYDPSIAEDGTTPDLANFLAWAPTTKGLEITFAEYQVGAGGLGLPVITVPWSAFSTVLDSDGPLAFLTGV